MGEITISDFIQKYYRIFWDNQNLDKNTFLPQEQLITVNRHIIWAAYKLGIKCGTHCKTTTLSGETAKYHICGDQSLNDSVMGMGTDYRRQPACRIFHGDGNFGTRGGGGAAASRYTSIVGTPILDAICKDIPFADKIVDETGLEVPAWISMPFPMILVNGCAQIGLGKAAYFCERDVREIMNWIESTFIKGEIVDIPHPISSTNCKVWINPKNGYTVYEAVIRREKYYDYIEALPPKISTYNLIGTLKKKLPKNIAARIEDQSGEGNPVCIKVPTGYLNYEDLGKYHLSNARKEAFFIWDESLGTMRMSTFKEVASIWFEARKKIVAKRLTMNKEALEKMIYKINLIEIYVKEGMNTWKSAQIEDYFGKEDADIILSTAARMFLPENLDKNIETRKKHEKAIRILNKNLENIGQFIIDEAREIIEEQEKFFAERD